MEKFDKSPSGNESESIAEETKTSVNKEEFNNWLINKITRQSTMISRSYGEKIIDYLRILRENGSEDATIRAKYTSSFRFQVKKRKFQLVNVVGLGDILCLPVKDKSSASHAMLGQNRQLIFKEDMFDVIEAAHKNGSKHRGYKGTFVKLSATYCSIPRDVVRKYVSLCKFCQKEHACYIPTSIKNHAKTQSKDKSNLPPKKKEFEMQFMTRCQIDILDMQSTPDTEGNFYFIGHFTDHHTKYNVLFPLKTSDAAYVARKLCRYVLGHFGLPQIMHSNMGRKYVDELITWILQFWSTDAQIINGNPRTKRLASILQQRQRTIMILIETIQSKQIGCPNWSLWLPGIQYTLNTNQFEPNNIAAYENVFKQHPKVYSYSLSCKDIPREEDMLEDEDEEHSERSLNEVLAVSVSDFMQDGSSLLLTQINDTNTNKTREDESNSISSPNILTAATLDDVGLSLNEQYTIIGTTLSVDGQTIQVPYVGISAASLSKSVMDAQKFHSQQQDFRHLNELEMQDVTESTEGKETELIIATKNEMRLSCLEMGVDVLASDDLTRNSHM
ncbi:SCAN domain-containing protein 3 [Hydra vulgaris]|uniref:SCAN domain-containing protein 3 n=1 Tax=Hydra vulgaris TaxID=6087 RepID=UPI0006414D79|nr:SCAN domain-containing protein 3 [Hydra vulgaris]